jgi:hypothetical protein
VLVTLRLASEIFTTIIAGSKGNSGNDNPILRLSAAIDSAKEKKAKKQIEHAYHQHPG